MTLKEKRHKETDGAYRTVLWSRTDAPGMDACRYLREDNGWLISGCAVFGQKGEAAKLDYQVNCDCEWRSISAQVGGWIGQRPVNLNISKNSGVWVLNSEPLAMMDSLPDIDLGFTPATNTNAINRLDLQTGEIVETTAVWLDIEDWTFKPLVQTYERKSETGLHYTSPGHGYEAALQVTPFGIVDDYPGLWERAL